VATNFYALCLGLINQALGSNYLYLCNKPAHSSLLDYLGPWPWYILSLELMALFVYMLCYLPVWLAAKTKVTRNYNFKDVFYN
jgi:uncharacterized membrane protein YwaF